MCIDHDMMSGRLFDSVEIMVVHPLPVVMFSPWINTSNISALNSIVSVFFHKFIGRSHLSFVTADGRRGFMVHHQFNSLGAGIIVQCRDVEIGIGSDEIENILFREFLPIFPTDIPSLYQHFVESVFSCEIDVFANIGIVGRMSEGRFA